MITIMSIVEIHELLIIFCTANFYIYRYSFIIIIMKYTQMSSTTECYQLNCESVMYLLTFDL